MKKFRVAGFGLFVVCCLLVGVGGVYSQSPDSLAVIEAAQSPVAQAEDAESPLANGVFLFTSIAAFAASLIALEEIIDRAWDLNGLAAQIRVGVTGIVISTVLAWQHMFLFSTPEAYGTMSWYMAGPIVGFVAALLAMFGFQNPTIGVLLRGVLEALGIRPKWSDIGGQGVKAGTVAEQSVGRAAPTVKAAVVAGAVPQAGKTTVRT